MLRKSKSAVHFCSAWMLVKNFVLTDPDVKVLMQLGKFAKNRWSLA